MGLAQAHGLSLDESAGLIGAMAAGWQTAAQQVQLAMPTDWAMGGAGVLFEELEDAEHAVVDVTKPRRLSFLGMVKASGPINDDIVLVIVETDGAAD